MPVYLHQQDNKGLYIKSERLTELCKEFHIPLNYDINYMEYYVPSKFVIKFLTIATAQITMITVEQVP